MPPRISVVILSWNTLGLTRECLRALRRNPPRDPAEIIVVDNGSDDGSPAMIREDFPEVHLIANPDNRLYSAGNNQGARVATGEWLVLLNSDTEVQPGALDTLVDWLEAHPTYGGVAPQLLNPDGTIQHGCARIPGLMAPLWDSTIAARLSWAQRFRDHISMADFDHAHEDDVEQPPAACFVMRRSEFMDMGGLDEELSLYFNDVDLCSRLLSAGRKIRFLPSAQVIHHLGASTQGFHDRNGKALWFQNRLSFYRKHHGRPGSAWLKSILMLWGIEVGGGIVLGSKNLGEKREALADLGRHLVRSIGRNS